MKKLLFPFAFGVACALNLPLHAATLPPTPASAAASKVTTTGNPYEHIETLPNGITFVSRRDHLAPRVAFSLLIRVGANAENTTNVGWRRLVTNATLHSVPTGFPGDDSKDDLALALAAQSAGGELGATVGDDVIEYYAVGDSNRSADLLKLLLAVWQTPRLSDDDINSARTRQKSQIDAQDLDIAQLTAAALQAQIFHDDKGQAVAYGLPELGSPKSLDELTNDRVRSYHRQFMGAKIVFSAAGDVDEAGIREALSTLPASATAEAPAPVFSPVKKGQPPFVVREAPTLAASVVVSYPLGTVADADAPALRVMTSLLSESREARLARRLLNDSLGTPLAISVAGQLVPRRFGNELLLTAQTTTQSVDGVKNALIDEVRKLREGTISDKELQAAKTFVRGNWSLERQSPRERSFLSALSLSWSDVPDGTWPVRVQSVTSADISRVAKKYLGNYAVALVMPRTPQN